MNAINPGMAETEGVIAAGFHQGEFRKQMEALTPLGRIGQVGDVAPAAVFFASQGCRLDHGRNLANCRRIALKKLASPVPPSYMRSRGFCW